MAKIQKRPTIAIDVDGVLRNNLWMMVDMYNKELGTKMKISDVKEFKTELSFPLIREKLGISSSDWFFQVHAKELFLMAPAYPDVADDIERLKQVADVVIVTYQKTYENKMFTLKWLETHGIEPHGICFLRDKTIVHADALVDDNHWNFIGTHVELSALVDAPYNSNISIEEMSKENNTNMVRVKSLHDFTERFLSGQITLKEG
jgi:5'(3')-deoxyribonucleotidase